MDKNFKVSFDLECKKEDDKLVCYTYAYKDGQYIPLSKLVIESEDKIIFEILFKDEEAAKEFFKKAKIQAKISEK